MKIEYHDKDLAGIIRPYYTVLVEKDELVVAGGKTLPYSAWIGTIDTNGKITLWHPAAYRPRGYDDAAMALLEQAREKVLEMERS